jgi:hypothetical protein
VTDPWRLVGNFSADDAPVPTLEPVKKNISTGDIAPQGFPRYHGGLSYVQDVVLPDDVKGKKVALSIAGTADCVDVRVNGKPAGVCWWQWDADITSIVKPGKNAIELVYHGIAQNMLQTNIKPQGLTGKVVVRITG